jgi:hypothetical protein
MSKKDLIRYAACGLGLILGSTVIAYFLEKAHKYTVHEFLRDNHCQFVGYSDYEDGQPKQVRYECAGGVSIRVWVVDETQTIQEGLLLQ